jgi:hypothetical protein
VFGFLKELVAAAKEGVDEAKTEAAEEKAANAERSRVERAARATELAGQVAATSAEEIFAVALGAVYRETFLGELAAAAEQDRTPAYLYLSALPPEEVESIRKLLRRDFDARGPAQVVEAAVVLEQSLGTDLDGDALVVARGCWLVTAAAGADLVEPERMLELTQPFVLHAGRAYSSWAEFGQRFLAGERISSGSNPLGRRALARTVEALAETPGSPWHDRPWPGWPDAEPTG